MAYDPWISPRHRRSYLASNPLMERRIDVFEAQRYGWQLDIAEHAANGKTSSSGRRIRKGIEHSGFAVLHILFSYFETIAKYEAGFDKKGKSECFFRKGMRSVYPEFQELEKKMQGHDPAFVETILSILYDEVRNGLYHGGATGGRIELTGSIEGSLALDPANQRVAINPHKLPARLKSHFGDYISRLRDPKNQQERETFQKRFDFDTSYLWQPKSGGNGTKPKS